MDPIGMMQDWLAPGVPGEDGYFPLIALATVDASGAPDVRHVLLSEIADGNVYFHSDTRSRKVIQLGSGPAVALALNLPDSRRQITMTGLAHPADQAELERAYRKRSRYLQLLAWLNTPDMAQAPDSERAAVWAAFESRHPEGSLTPPETWCGFAVVPDRLTFWQGFADAPSHRLEFHRSQDGWEYTDLPG